jgi:hypothetical protein
MPLLPVLGLLFSAPLEPVPFGAELPPIDGTEPTLEPPLLNVPLFEAALLVFGALLLAAVPPPLPELAPLVAYGDGCTFE